jgi:hypothetical protein
MKIRGSMQVFSIIPEIAENVYLIVKEKLEDTKGVNGRRTHNAMGIKKKDKMTNTDLQSTTQKTKICSGRTTSS